jgi:hypothetical protein
MLYRSKRNVEAALGATDGRGLFARLYAHFARAA